MIRYHLGRFIALVPRVRHSSSTAKPPKELQLKFTAPAPKLCVGFRGNHNHGKRLYDQVYPTTKVPTAFVPRYPLDWRNAGRFILTAALARIEGKRIYRHPHSLDYQSSPHCGLRCVGVCEPSYFKCLCSMRSSYSDDHVAKIDSVLMSFKGPIATKKPLFSLPKSVPKKHTSLSNKLLKSASSPCDYKVVRKVYRYPVFQSRENKSTSVYHAALAHKVPYSIFDVKVP